MLMTKNSFIKFLSNKNYANNSVDKGSRDWHLLRLKASAVYHDLNELMKYILILHKTEYSHLFCLMTKLTITTTTTKTYLFNWCHYSQSGM